MAFRQLVGLALAGATYLVFYRLHKRRAISSQLTADTISDQESKDSEPPSSSSTAAGHEYEVFLSFRGADTRTGFTDYLYHTMKDAGIHVFRDNEELRVGEEIGPDLLQGIRKSKICIPIFSKGYASSKWCLRELAFMVESRRTRDQMVLPVFYDVTPHQVRHQMETYTIAFSKHAKRYDNETVQQWRDALAEVGQLKGWELMKETDGHEGQLTKLIVTKVLSELKKAYLVVPENLVGMNNHAKSTIDLLNLSVKNVRMVGIWGIGGIGKTTLAKFIFNQILDEFECCSFLKDIRARSQQYNGLEGLQTQLVFDLSKVVHRNNFTSIDEGIGELEHRFREKKVLFLLDDIDHVRQLNALVKEVGWFGPGSRIIITTRNRDILDVHQVSGIYEVMEMDQEDALRLFCKHAFRQDAPKDKLKALSDDVVKTTGGLPLALEVIGSYLSQKRKLIWEETLQRLKRAPKEEVEECLRISYERLDDDQKQMFLDVACLVIGEDIDVVTQVRKDREISAETGKNVLLVMCLIKIGDDNKIWMHDQLRDLGREIVRKENAKELGKRSRLWREDEARGVLEKQLGSHSIEALCLRFDLGTNYCVSDEHLRNLSKLWFLQQYHCELTGNFQQVLSELRWLRWQCSSQTDAVPTNLYLEKMLVLDLSFSNIRDDWICWSSIQMAVKLKVLNLRSCTELKRTPNFSMLTNLERLILDDCSWLEVIDPSIGKLENLTTLSMKNCWMVDELPISRDMMKLEILHINGCHAMGWVPCIGQLSSLRDLNLSSTGISELSIGSLTNLQRLSLANCGLDELPDSIGELKSLHELDLSGNNFPSLPNSICDLENLRILKIAKVDLRYLPDAIGSLTNLQNLTLASSPFLRKLPDSIGNLRSLHELDLSGTRFSTLPSSICDLESLEVFKIFNSCICSFPNAILHFEKLHIIDNFVCESLKGNISKEKWTIGITIYLRMIENLNRLEVLHELKFSGDRDYEQRHTHPVLARLKGVEALQNLHVIGCESFENMTISSNLKFLVRLDFHGCQKLQQVEGLDGLEALEELNVTECGAIEKLPSLAKLRSLRTLKFSYCEKLQELEGLDGLEGLEELNLISCGAIEKLTNLSKLKSLRTLKFSYCEKLQELEGLGGMEGLEELNITWCGAIEKLPNLTKLRSLRTLKFSYCEKLQELEGLDGLEGLQELYVERCGSIEKLPNLTKFRSLRTLKFSYCEKLQELEGLDGLEGLQELYLERCGSIEKLPNLTKLRSLRTLKFSYCEKLQELEGLDGLEGLQELYLERCGSIEKLPNLTKLRSLRTLKFSYCEKLQELEGLDGMEGLEELSITWCGAIEKLPNLTKLRSLRTLKFSYCEKLQELEGLDGLEGLQELYLERCKEIEKLPSFSNLKCLKILRFDECEKLKELEGFGGMEGLEELNITWCGAIEKLPNLTKLRSLRTLKFSYCGKLQELEGLDGLEGLQGLYLVRCIEIEKLPNFSNLKRLKLLDIFGFKKLQEIEGLEQLEALEMLSITSCKAIEKLPNLSKLKHLRGLDCSGCKMLQEIEGLDRLEELDSLCIYGCKSIRHIPNLPQHMKSKSSLLDLRGCEKYREIHRDPSLGKFCSICQLGAEDLGRLSKY